MNTTHHFNHLNTRITINTTTLSPPKLTNDSLYMDSYNVGFNPYSTLPVRFSTSLKPAQTIRNTDYRFKIRQIVNSPFRRISRVERLISDQKNKNIEETSYMEEMQILPNSHVFKPQFKVKTRKYDTYKHRQQPIDNHTQQSKLKLHLKNLRLDNQSAMQAKEEHKNLQNLNYFQENLKNKMRITRKNQKKRHESSLLEMLNRISNSSPTQRYKSKPTSSAVTAFPQPLSP